MNSLGWSAGYLFAREAIKYSDEILEPMLVMGYDFDEGYIKLLNEDNEIVKEDIKEYTTTTYVHSKDQFGNRIYLHDLIKVEFTDDVIVKGKIVGLKGESKIFSIGNVSNLIIGRSEDFNLELDVIKQHKFTKIGYITPGHGVQDK